MEELALHLRILERVRSRGGVKKKLTMPGDAACDRMPDVLWKPRGQRGLQPCYRTRRRVRELHHFIECALNPRLDCESSPLADWYAADEVVRPASPKGHRELDFLIRQQIRPAPDDGPRRDHVVERGQAVAVSPEEKGEVLRVSVRRRQ